ncbi:zinc transporter ZupT [Caproiciproducens sp. MSJ-32]|uniref:zinc transporter ZupT n=1 Tax=Caproiciproducens sp. MSJ-32 TaxID=2841527 RepID=UPI001C118A39|nr:zinc transporter ZupT [Caproiciproducens sp. MSJ-32]MBU5453932.1 zinc transporter ZupT [Caproiciproducens sp. MSJ-32]
MFENNTIIPLTLSLLAGLSTILGAFVVFFANFNKNKLITFSLAFSAGVMMTVSFIDLFMSSMDNLCKNYGNLIGIFYSITFLISGALITALIDKLLDKNSIVKNQRNSSKNLFRVGLISMLGLMIHNFPEGVATFISGYENLSLGISVALAISLHNIPEGISISLPIYYSTKSKYKAFKYCFLSGIAEPLGALAAFLFLKPYINETILSLTFLLVAGIMLYISFMELIPTAKSYGYNKLYAISLFLGICIIPISHVFVA